MSPLESFIADPSGVSEGPLSLIHFTDLGKVLSGETMDQL